MYITSMYSTIMRVRLFVQGLELLSLLSFSVVVVVIAMDLVK